jgi:predicted SnoaL-like aldol condensation-catalyzing enzyme
MENIVMRNTLLSRKPVVALLATATVALVTACAPAPATSAPASDAAPAQTAAPDWESNPDPLERNKGMAVHVLKRLFEDGDLSVADRYIRPDYIQHNPNAADGTEPLKEFVRAETARNPDLQYNVVRVLAEGDMVLVHGNVVNQPGTRGIALVDMFRIQDGLIAEHWDVLQDVPETTASGNDMFGTVSEPRTNEPGPREQTQASKELAVRYFDRLMVEKDPGAVEYLAPEYHQHNPTIPSGSAGLREMFGAFFQQTPTLTVERHRVIAEGNIVAIHAHYRLNPEDRGQSVVDIFRVLDGKIVEHWDVIQAVPETSANDNTMF